MLLRRTKPKRNLLTTPVIDPAPSISWSAGVLTVTFTHPPDATSHYLHLYVDNAWVESDNVGSINSPHTFDVAATAADQDVYVVQEANNAQGQTLLESNTITVDAVIPATYTDAATSVFGRFYTVQSGGVVNGVTSPGNVFDNSLSTQATAGASGTGGGWIGQDFGSGNEKNIRKFTIKQGLQGNSTYAQSTLMVQYKDFGSASDDTGWTSAEQLTGLPTSFGSEPSVQERVLSADYGAHRHWRLKAGQFTNWRVYEAEFMTQD